MIVPPLRVQDCISLTSYAIFFYTHFQHFTYFVSFQPYANIFIWLDNLLDKNLEMSNIFPNFAPAIEDCSRFLSINGRNTRHKTIYLCQVLKKVYQTRQGRMASARYLSACPLAEVSAFAYAPPCSFLPSSGTMMRSRSMSHRSARSMQAR